jgi:hypothetical protein
VGSLLALVSMESMYSTGSTSISSPRMPGSLMRVSLAVLGTLAAYGSLDFTASAVKPPGALVAVPPKGLLMVIHLP